jgi:hypothetical protein
MKTTSAALFISVSLVVFGIGYYYFTTRHKERMAIMEKGLSPDIFKGLNNYLPLLLTLGIVSIGISAGIAVGYLLHDWLSAGAIYAVPFSIFFFLGISLLASYVILKRMNH